MANVYKPGLLQVKPQYTPNPDAPDHPENILWFVSATTTTPTLANLVSISDVFDTNWANVWIQVGADPTYYLGSVITDWSSNTGLQYSSVGVFTPQNGLGGTVPSPPQVAALISYHVPVRYRGGHPRSYLPYVASEVLTNVQKDTINTSTTAAMASNLNTLITDMKASGVLGGQTMVAYLKKNNPTEANIQEFPTFTVQGLVATQRRRVRKAPHH